eukprot:1424379-Pleurochrysis_carterae.AAC.1
MENDPPRGVIFQDFSLMFYAPTVLCGTMFGHRVFRHRLFLSSDKLQLHLSCAHVGKHVGSRGHSQDQTKHVWPLQLAQGLSRFYR